MSYPKKLLLFALITVSLVVSGQYTKEFKRIFFEADYLYETHFYEDAFNRYKNLLTLDPGNYNILFHCGACCLNIPGNEEQAVTYLQEAVKGVSMSYKEKSHKEAGAPVLTYFMLGKAYHLNNSFENAMENYKLYMEIGEKQDPTQLAYAELQIAACERAAEVNFSAPAFKFHNVLGHFEDELPSCNNPVISGDGKILVFLVDYPNDQKIMMSTLEGDFWSRPKMINSEIGMVGETSPVSLSYDGLTLYLVHHFYSHSDLLVSHFDGNRWSGAEALGPNVNGRTSEGHASISKDGRTLYFTSDIRGGEGSMDIYLSRLNEKGEWGAAENLGPVINTPFEEHSPFISANDSILFFSSQGHKSIGGLDVFYSELGKDGKWKEPRNMGYPVNTTAENVFFNPGWNEQDAIYAVRRADDPTSNSINMVIEIDPVEAAAAEDDTVLDVISLETALEPEETDEIRVVLNDGRTPPETEESEEEPEAPVIIYVEQDSGSRALQTMVAFAHNKYGLSMAAIIEVERIAELMHGYPQSTILLTGHADGTGSPEYNVLLSSQRALQIAEYLEVMGIERDRITMEGKGESEPVARNSYPDGRDAPLGRFLNRQVIATVNNPEPMQGELAGFFVPVPLKATNSQDDLAKGVSWFTVQLGASLKPQNLNSFKGAFPAQQYVCRDGYYRYASGKFQTFEQAHTYLEQMKASGYPDAFIQTMIWYAEAVVKK